MLYSYAVSIYKPGGESVHASKLARRNTRKDERIQSKQARRIARIHTSK
jgi:hypothetical protein